MSWRNIRVSKNNTRRTALSKNLWNDFNRKMKIDKMNMDTPGPNNTNNQTSKYLDLNNSVFQDSKDPYDYETQS